MEFDSDLFGACQLCGAPREIVLVQRDGVAWIQCVNCDDQGIEIWPGYEPLHDDECVRCGLPEITIAADASGWIATCGACDYLCALPHYKAKND